MSEFRLEGTYEAMQKSFENLIRDIGDNKPRNLFNPVEMIKAI